MDGWGVKGFLSIGQGWQTGLCCLLIGTGSSLLGAAPIVAPQLDEEAPQVRALLEQGWAAESGRGLRRSPALAALLYREAGHLGSGEGYYRAALISLPQHGTSLPPTVRCQLAIASRLGHHQAQAILERQGTSPPPAACTENPPDTFFPGGFDLDAYVGGLPISKQRIVGLIRRLAPHYQVDPHLALAVAAVESNFNNLARSPKSAMGVMQLIPATAERFGVGRPFDPEQNIRGGLSYLRWLDRYFRGDLVRILAAYNAGEKAVDHYGGIPPYPETRAYVQRVLAFSAPRAERHNPPPIHRQERTTRID